MHPILRFAKMVLPNMCAAPGMTWPHFFLTDALRQMVAESQIYGSEAVSSALKFPFWKEVSRNCFVFDVVKFRKSYKSASFLAGSSSQIDTTALFSSVQIDRLDRYL